MAHALYAIRRRLGQCVRCGQPTKASLCNPCRRAINARARQRRWALAQHHERVRRQEDP